MLQNESGLVLPHHSNFSTKSNWQRTKPDPSEACDRLKLQRTIIRPEQAAVYSKRINFCFCFNSYPQVKFNNSWVTKKTSFSWHVIHLTNNIESMLRISYLSFCMTVPTLKLTLIDHINPLNLLYVIDCQNLIFLQALFYFCKNIISTENVNVGFPFLKKMRLILVF